MPTTKLLSQLTLAKKPIKPAFSPGLHRRNKLLVRLQEQREMARCMIEGESFIAYRDKWVKDEDGVKQKVSLPKQVRQWYYVNENKYYLGVRYGNKPLELARGKAAIEVGDSSNLLNVIDTVIEAVQAGELDSLLMAVKKPGNKGIKKVASA